MKKINLKKSNNPVRTFRRNLKNYLDHPKLMRKFRSLLLFFNSLKEQNEISEICSSKMRFTKIRTKPEKTYQNMKPQLNMGIINNLPEK